MGWGTIAKPGSRYGPCTEPCHHRDCAATRRMSESICRHCQKPIGYETAFFQEGNLTELVHRDCAWAEVDRERQEKERNRHA